MQSLPEFAVSAILKASRYLSVPDLSMHTRQLILPPPRVPPLIRKTYTLSRSSGYIFKKRHDNNSDCPSRRRLYFIPTEQSQESFNGLVVQQCNSYSSTDTRSGDDDSRPNGVKHAIDGDWGIGEEIGI